MTNHYLNLMTQVDKLHRHNRQGSFKTRARYYEAMQRFCRFLADAFRLERLANIAQKAYLFICNTSPRGRQGNFYHQDGPRRHPVLPRPDPQRPL